MPEKEFVYNLRKRNVKRMLWPVDHESIKKDLRKEDKKLKKEMARKYNFDFEAEQPIMGKYNWVPVGMESPISSPRFLRERDSEIENVCCSTTSTNKRMSKEATPSDDNVRQKQQKSKKKIIAIRKKNRSQKRLTSVTTTSTSTRSNRISSSTSIRCRKKTAFFSADTGKR